jgi:hypothetical protein
MTTTKFRPILPLALLLAAAPSSASGQSEDALSCARDAETTIALAGDYGTQQFHWFAPADHTVFDARGARWRFQTYPVPLAADPVRITGGGQSACFIGGLIEGTNDPAAGWEETYERSNGAAIAFGGDEALADFVLDGIRIHNVWDGIRPRANADRFVITDVWLSDGRDDCIENDHFSTGTLEDSLLDGCHMAISARNPRDSESYGSRVLTIQNSLIRLKPFPKPREAMLRRHSWARDPGHAMFFKWRSTSMQLRLRDNVFMLEQLPNNQRQAIELPEATSCSKNVLVWLGSGDPGPVPDCFEVVRDRAVWDRAKADWVARHPELMRLPHDPPSDRAPVVAPVANAREARGQLEAEDAECQAQAGVLACERAVCRCVPYTVGRSSTSGADVTVVGTVVDVDTANVGGPWQVKIDAAKSGTIEVEVPSGNRDCQASWDLDEIRGYRPGDRIAARGFVFGPDRVRVCMASSHYIRKSDGQ